MTRNKPSIGADGRIRDERFRSGVERDVQKSGGFMDHTKLVFATPELEDDYNDLIDCLLAGALVPERFYRNRIDQKPDPLLAAEGIKHLHLGGSDSDIIVFLVEYEDRVVILEISDHTRFASKPPGSLLLQVHKATLAKEDGEAAQRKAQRVQEKREILRNGLRPKGPA